MPFSLNSHKSPHCTLEKLRIQEVKYSNLIKIMRIVRNKVGIKHRGLTPNPGFDEISAEKAPYQHLKLAKVLNNGNFHSFFFYCTSLPKCRSEIGRYLPSSMFSAPVKWSNLLGRKPLSHFSTIFPLRFHCFS